jgi:hypothetical protein
MFELRREGLQEAGENYMRSFIICIHHQIFLVLETATCCVFKLIKLYN